MKEMVTLSRKEQKRLVVLNEVEMDKMRAKHRVRLLRRVLYFCGSSCSE